MVNQTGIKPQLLFAGQGGGAWGCFPAGALYEYFQQSGQAYDGGFGVSVNALHVSLLMSTTDGTIPDLATQKQSADKLKDFWFNLQGNGSVYKPWPKKKLSSILVGAALSLIPMDVKIRHAATAFFEGKNSVYDNAPLASLLQGAVGGKQWHPSVRVGVVDYQTQLFKEISLGNNPQWADAVLASTAIPIAFPPKVFDWDGGVMDKTPLKGVFKRFRELRESELGRDQELHVYRCSPFPDHKNTGKKYNSLPAVAWRTIEIMSDNTDEEDFSNAKFYNQLSTTLELAEKSSDAALREALKARYAKYGKVNIYVISPPPEAVAVNMPPDAYTFDPQRIRSGFELGRQAMQRFLQNKAAYSIEALMGD